MKTNLKFLRMMSTLDEAELSRFGKYLRREHPNEGIALRVYDYYRRFFPGKENPARMSTAYAYRKIYRMELEDEVSEGKKIWNPMSKLSQWLKDFLLIEKLRSDEFTADVLWMKILHEKGLNAEYAKEAVAASEKDYGLYFDMEACQQQIELAKHCCQQLYTGKPFPDFSALEPYFWQIKSSADFISLQIECDWLTKKGMRPSNDLEGFEKRPPLHQIYHEIHQMLTTGEEKHFNAIEVLLQAHSSQISPQRADEILGFLQYYVARAIRGKDGGRWALKSNELNKVLVDRDIFNAHYAMRPDYFHNTVTTAGLASDYDWAIQFVEEYARYLPQKSREFNVSLAKASIALGLKDFSKVLELTETLRSRDEIQRLRINVLRLKSMYELSIDSTDLFNTYYTHLIRRRHPYASYKESAIDFLTVFNMLIQRKESKQTLLETIESKPSIFSRPWLMEKAATYRPLVYRKNKS